VSLFEESAVFIAIAFQFCKPETHVDLCGYSSRHRSFVKCSAFASLPRVAPVQSDRNNITTKCPVHGLDCILALL